eukprot:1643279-Pyramimonas_sp.AAC.2
MWQSFSPPSFDVALAATVAVTAAQFAPPSAAAPLASVAMSAGGALPSESVPGCSASVPPSVSASSGCVSCSGAFSKSPLHGRLCINEHITT